MDAHAIPSVSVAPITTTDDADLGIATVWHEGSRSFYEARLLRRLSSEDMLREALHLSKDWQEGTTSPLFPAPAVDETVHVCRYGGNPCAACQAAERNQ